MERTLPVVVAGDRHQDAPGVEPGEALRRINARFAQPKPQDVHWGTEIARDQPRACANHRVAAVACDRKISLHFYWPISGPGTDTRNVPVLLPNLDCLGAHQQPKRRISLATLREEIEEVPLRHQRNEFAARGQTGEIRERIFPSAEVSTLG